MAENVVKVRLGIDADVTAAKKAISSLETSLTNLRKAQASRGFEDFGLNEAVQNAKVLESSLNRAFNQNTSKLDLSVLNKNLREAGTSINEISAQFLRAGTVGQQAFMSLATAVAHTEVPLKTANRLVQSFARTLKNTTQYQISATMYQGVTRAISDAISYTKNLNSSLNDIRIVTGQSAAEMAKFAQAANASAQKLSTTTNFYAKASLIFYQQGLSDAEVKKRTDAVIKMANVTKENMEDVSSYMTAVWNNFDDGSKSLEHYADVMTALGATTASSTKEIAAGLEKFASIGKTIGLSYDYATSALATIVSKTRQSADTVGTGLRTIFSRLQGLSLGETLEDGVDLNKYSSALKTVGVNVLDATGNMRNMDAILESLAGKWQNLSAAQKTALAQTVGGVRQYTTLISLMDNWDSMKQNLNTAKGADGSLQRQQDIYAESWEAAASRSKAAVEELFSTLLNDKGFIKMTNGLTAVTKAVTALANGFGGLPGILSTIGMIATKVFSQQITSGISNSLLKLNTWAGQFQGNSVLGKIGAGVKGVLTGKTKSYAQVNAEKEISSTQAGYEKTMSQLEASGKKDSAEYYSVEAASKLLAAKQQLMATEGSLTAAQKARAQADITAMAEEQAAVLALRQEKEALAKAEKQASTSDTKNVIRAGSAQTGVRKDGSTFVRSNDAAANWILSRAPGHSASNGVRGLLDLRQKYSQAAYQTTMANKYSGALKQMSPSDTQGRKQLMASINKTFGAGTVTKIEDIEKALQKIVSAANAAEKEIDEVIDGAKQADREAGNALEDYLGQGRSHGESQGMIDWEEAVRTKQIPTQATTAQEQEAQRRAMEKMREEKAAKIASGMQKASQAVMSFSAGLSQASTLMATLGDESASTAEKITSTMSVASSAVSAFATGGILGGVAYLAGFALTAGLDAIDKAYRKEEIAAEQAQADAEALQNNYKTLQEGYDNLLSTFDSYKDGSKTLDSLITGTDEWKEALIQTNEAALQLINSLGLMEGQDYTIGTNGEITFTKEGQNRIDQAQSDKLQETLTAQSAANLAQAEAASARAKADLDAAAKSNDKGRWAVAGTAAAAGAAGGAWGGAALGSIIPGVGNLIGGVAGAIIGGVGGLLGGLFTYDKVKEQTNQIEKDKVNAIVKKFEDRNGTMTDSELKDLIDKQFTGESESYKKSILKVVKSTVEANKQLNDAIKLAAQNVLNSNEIYNSMTNSDAQEDVSARASKIYKDAAEVAGAKFDSTTDKETRKQWAQEYAASLTAGKQGVDIQYNDDGSFTYSYIGDDGHVTEDFPVTETMLRTWYKSSQGGAAVNAEVEALSQIYTDLREGKVEGISKSSQAAIASMSSRGNLNDMTGDQINGFSDADLEALTQDQLTALGFVDLADAKAKRAEMRAAYVKEWNALAAEHKGDGGFYHEYADSGDLDWSKSMSLNAFKNFDNTLNELENGPIAEIGKKLNLGIEKAFEEANVSEEDRTALLDQISQIVWSDYDAFEQFEAVFEDMGYSIDTSSGEWDEFITTMRQAGLAIPDFSKLKADLNAITGIVQDLELGSIISKEDYQALITYHKAWEDFFVLQADGSRKFIGDAEAMTTILKQNIADQKDLLDIYKKASEVEGVDEFNWKDAKRDGAIGEFSNFYYNNSDFQAILEEAGYSQTRIAEILSAASEGNTAELEKLFSWINKAIDPEVIKQTGIELEQMIASMATSVEELQALRDLGVDNGGIGDKTYQDSLIAMASGYEYCATAIDNYREALKTGNPEIIAAAEDALEASIMAEQAAEKYDDMYNHALSGKSSMTLADLKLLKETNEELYNSFLTMSEADWYEASYDAYMNWLDTQIAGHEKEFAEYTALMLKKQQLNEDYYENLTEKHEKAYENIINSYEEYVDKIENAVDAISIFDDGTPFSQQSFESIAKLKAALEDVGYSAEEVQKILNSLGQEEDKTDAETSMAAAKAKTDLLLMEMSKTEHTQEKVSIEVVEVQVRSTTPAYDPKSGDLIVNPPEVIKVAPGFDDATLEGSVLTLSADGQALTVTTAAGDTITVKGSANIKEFLAAASTSVNGSPVLTWNGEAWSISFEQGTKNAKAVVSGDVSSFAIAVLLGHLKYENGAWTIPTENGDSIEVDVLFDGGEPGDTKIEWIDGLGYTVKTADGIIHLKVDPDDNFSKISANGDMLSFLNGEGEEVTYQAGVDFDSLEKNVNEAGELVYSLIKDGTIIDSIIDVSKTEESILDIWGAISNIEVVIGITYQDLNPESKPAILSEVPDENGQIVRELVYVISYDNQGRRETLGVGTNKDLPGGEHIEYDNPEDDVDSMVVSTDVINEVRGWLFATAAIDKKGVPDWWNPTTALIGTDESNSEDIIESLAEHFNWLQDFNTYDYRSGKADYSSMSASIGNRWINDAWDPNINFFNALWDSRWGMDDENFDKEYRDAYRIMWDDMSSYVLDAISSQQRYGRDFYSYQSEYLDSGYGFNSKAAIDTLRDILIGYGMNYHYGDLGAVQTNFTSGQLWNIAENDPEFMSFYNDALKAMLTQHAMNLFPEMEAEAAYDALAKNTDEMSGIMQGLLAEFTNVYGDAYNLEGVDSGGQLIAGMIVGIVDACPGLLATLDETTRAIIEQFRAGLGIASPSKHTIEMGKWLAKGLEQGLAESDIDTSKFTDKVLTSIFDGLKTSLDGKDFNEFKDTFLNSLLPENVYDGIKESVINASDDPNAPASPAEDTLRYETTDGQTFTTQAAAQAHQRSLALGNQYGMSVQQADDGKTYNVVDNNNNVLSSGHANENLAYQALEDAAFYSGVMANYFAKNPIEGSINFLTDKNYSDVQKGYIQKMVDEAVQAFNEANGTTFESWDEIIASDASNVYDMIGYLDDAYQESNFNFLQSTQETWAQIKDIWSGELSTQVAKENEAAQEVYDIWVDTFKAIVAARKAILDGESFASVLDTEDQMRLIEQWGFGGLDNSTIMAKMFQTDGRKESDLAFQPFNPAESRVGAAKYLAYASAPNGSSYLTSTSLTQNPDGSYKTEGHIGYANFEREVRNDYGAVYDNNFMRDYGSFITGGWAAFEQSAAEQETTAQAILLEDPDAFARFIMEDYNAQNPEADPMTLEMAKLLAVVAADFKNLEGYDPSEPDWLRNAVIDNAIARDFVDGLPEAYQSAWESQMQSQIDYNQQMLDYETYRYNTTKSNTSEAQSAIQAAINFKRDGTAMSVDDRELLDKILPNWQSMNIDELEAESLSLASGLDDASYALAVFTAALQAGAMFMGYDANGNALFSQYQTTTQTYNSEADAIAAAEENGGVVKALEGGTWQVESLTLTTPVTADQLGIKLPERTSYNEEYTAHQQQLGDAQAAGFSDLTEQDDYIKSMVAQGNDKEFNDGGMQSVEEIMKERGWDPNDTESMEKAIAIQRKYANQLKLMEEGLEELSDNGEDWLDVLEDSTASVADQSKALGNLRKSYGKILGLGPEMSKLGDDFLKDADNMKLAMLAASDSGEAGQQALDELQAKAAASITPFDDLTTVANNTDQTMSDLATTISEIDLDAGALFEGADFTAVDNYWNTVLDKCISAGMSLEDAVATANSALSGLGVDVEPGFDIVTEDVPMDQFETFFKKTGSTTMTVDAGNGQTREITLDNYEQIYKDKGVSSIPISYLQGKDASGANRYTKKAERTGGSGGSGGSGGGGGGRRDPKRANHTTVDQHAERYHEIDNTIDDLADAYERLNKEQDRAWGKNRIDAMKQEEAILQEQIAAIKEKMKQAEDYRKKDLAAAQNDGWIFDENGNVANYEDNWNKWVNKYNDKMTAYENMSAEQQEKEDEKYSKMMDPETGEYYSGYEDYWKKQLLDGPKESLEKYEETMELLEDLGMEYDDFLNAWHDNIIGQIQTKLDTTLEVTEMQLGYLEHKLGRIEDDAYKTAEAIGLMADQMDAAQTNFNAYESALNELLQAYNEDWTAEGLMNGDISVDDLVAAGMESGDIELLQTIMNGMMESQEAMAEQMTSAFESMGEAFDEFNSDMDRYISTVEHAQTVTSTYRNIIDLTGKSMSGFNSVMLKSINDAIVAQSKAKLETNKTKYETNKTMYEQAKATYEQAEADYAAGKIDAAALKAAKETYQNAQDNMNEAQEAFLSSWEEALQAAADAFQSNMEAAIEDVGKMMSNGLAGGLAELEDQFAKLSEQDQNYVDDYEKIYQLTKMTRDLDSKIDSTSNVRAQKELLKYQKEINGLLESDQKMSKYDLDYLQKKLDLKMAEIAMDEAQNAKSQVTMRRDSEGNYNYVYTADENAVEKAEQEYADKLYEMQVANDEYITSLSETMAGLSSQMLSEIAAIDTTIYDTEEKYQAEVQRITEHYTSQMAYYNQEMNKVLGNNKTLYEQDWTDYSKYTGYKISAAEQYVTEWNQTMLAQVTGFDSQEEFYQNFNEAIFGNDPTNPSGSSLIGRLITAYKTMRQQIADANAAAGVETEDLASVLLGSIQNATSEAQNAATDITNAAQQITSEITSIGEAVTEMVNNYSQAMQTMAQKTDQTLAVLLNFLTAYGTIGDLDIDPGVLARINEARQQREAEGYDTGGYTGAWGTEGRLAFLHEKELVLNAMDTENMLASVGILRQIANVIDLNALASSGGFLSLLSTGISGNREPLQQEVHIEASFPGVTDKNQIEEAFTDLVNLAAQYANR